MKTSFCRLLPAMAGLVLGAAALFAVGCAGEALTYAENSYRQGMTLYNQRDYADAAGAFRNAIRQDPREYRYHYALGLCQDQLGQPHEAITAYRTALDVMPLTVGGRQDPEGYRQRIINAMANSIARSPQADVELDAMETRTRQSRSATDYTILAKVYRLRGDADSAINAYHQAVLFAPRDFELRKEYGLYLADNVNKPQQAEYQLRRAYALRPDDVQVTAALRRLGVVPGPALKEHDELQKPLLPDGPVPDVAWNDLVKGNKDSQPAANPIQPAAPAGGSSASAPRD